MEVTLNYYHGFYYEPKTQKWTPSESFYAKDEKGALEVFEEFYQAPGLFPQPFVGGINLAVLWQSKETLFIDDETEKTTIFRGPDDIWDEVTGDAQYNYLIKEYL